MAIGRTIALLALVASGALAQQYSGNYVDNDYDYEQGAAPAPPPRPAPQRSYSRPAPPPQPLRSSFSSAANAPRPTPVPILKQINRHNEDGSYTYGYEGADGSFKIETKLTTGEVMGKYGYVDDLGKVRVVEYGANKFGFQPSGEGITVAPPTLVDETTRRSKGGELPEYDDGSYYDAPAPAPRPAPRARPPPPPPRPAPQPAPRPQRPPPPPQQQFTSYESSYSNEQSFSAPAHRPSPPRPSPSSVGPAPPRAVVAGAAPAPVPQGGVVYSRPSAPRAPAPVRQPQPAGPPPVYHAQPVASFAPAPSPASRPSRGGGGILDQLARDYALPSGGSNPLTDISFSSYY